MSNITKLGGEILKYSPFYQNLFSGKKVMYFDMSSLIKPCDRRCLRMQDVSSSGQADSAVSNGSITDITRIIFIMISYVFILRLDPRN